MNLTIATAARSFLAGMVLGFSWACPAFHFSCLQKLLLLRLEIIHGGLQSSWIDSEIFRSRQTLSHRATMRCLCGALH